MDQMLGENKNVYAAARDELYGLCCHKSGDECDKE